MTIIYVPDTLKWDLADRMAKSLRVADIGVQEMAEYLGVHRNTVGGWLSGRIKPTKTTIQKWAKRTTVPFEWLKDGDGTSASRSAPLSEGVGSATGQPYRRRGKVRRVSSLPRLDSNQQPFGYRWHTWPTGRARSVIVNRIRL
jgi:transcriptional regulator with XRE-family HTH domain